MSAVNEFLMKLLVVEDDVRVRRMIVSLVSDLSDEIFECGDGKEAQSFYAEHLPDWVLMDVRMPEVDGITATRMIKSNHPEAKIIIVTTYDGEAIRETARSAGAFAYVLKEDLSDLRKILQSSPPSPPSPRALP